MAEEDVFATLAAESRIPIRASENPHSGASESPPDGDTPLLYTYGSLKGIEQKGYRELFPPSARTWLAVGDAARGAKVKSAADVFFVAPRVAARFGLDPKKLHRGLDYLEARGWIVTVESRRGKFRRIRYGPNANSKQ